MRLPLLLSGLALSACVSVLPDPPKPDAVFALDTLATRSGPALGTIVAVRRPDGPRLLTGANIVVRQTNGGQSVLGEAQWSDSLDTLLQYALIDALNLKTVDDGLAVAPRSGARADALVQWRIQDFVIEEEAARADAVLTVLDGADRTPRGATRLSCREPIGPNGSEIAALRRCADQIVAQAADFTASVASDTVTSN